MELTRDAAREVDRRAMAELGIPGIVLMENAARGIAAVTLTAGAGDGLIAVVCGPGNNGGDGYAAARHLANAGRRVQLIAVTPIDQHPAGSDAAVNAGIARAMGLEIRSDMALEGAAVVLDCVFGTGLTRPVREPLRRAIEAINASGALVIAVDLPSGLDADTGEILGVAVRADVTATMVAPKRGFRLAKGPTHVGVVEVVDIGVPPELVAEVAGPR